jgi:hypothetical protein
MTIVACPKCADSVMLPQRASQRATVRCPLCQETFPFADVLESIPPALIVIDDPEAGGAGQPSGSAAAESLASPPPTEPARDGGEFVPLSIETAGAGAPATAAPRRRRPATPLRRKPKSPLAEGIKIVLGGIAGLVIAQLILWYLGSNQLVKVNGDPFGLGPKVARYVPWIVPGKYRGQKPAGGAARENEGSGPAVVGAAVGVKRKELPKRDYVDPNGSASSAGAAKALAGKPNKSGSSLQTDAPAPFPADAPQANPFGIAVGIMPPDPAADLTTVPESEPSPPADMQLDVDMLPDSKPVADPLVTPVEEAPNEPTADVKSPPQLLPNAPRTTAAELASAATHARATFDAWRSAGDADARELIRQNYVAFAKLGEALAFRVEPAGAESRTVAELVQSLATDDAKLNTLGRAAVGWLKAVRREGSGVLLVGVVRQIRQQAGYDEIELKLTGSDQSVAVYRKSRAGETCSPDSKLLVLGAIIEAPSRNLAGYEGEASFVVWEGLSEKLPAP